MHYNIKNSRNVKSTRKKGYTTRKKNTKKPQEEQQQKSPLKNYNY